ncbi:hypothetical protein SynMITS9220_01129 [Synechococcus sp. MIT S9220]|nr:hypothetical protein SynMITS9220_01129 [Synechococcus sp. MIT S9220]
MTVHLSQCCEVGHTPSDRRKDVVGQVGIEPLAKKKTRCFTGLQRV